jgi:CheY-like chemotaxis protein
MAKILLIDDDEALRNVTVEILNSAGHVVDDAPDGSSGLALYATGRYDLIITDIAMPDMDGLELITNLARNSPVPRIIAMSGDSQFSESVYLPTARHLGVQATLSKPIRSETLLSAVEKVLAGPASG